MSDMHDRLNELAGRGIEYRTASVPLTGQAQLFFRDPAGNGVELQFAICDRVGEQPQLKFRSRQLSLEPSRSQPGLCLRRLDELGSAALEPVGQRP